MRRARFSFRLLQIALFALSLIALSEYFSNKYLGGLNRKIAQAIEEIETPTVSIVATSEE